MKKSCSYTVNNQFLEILMNANLTETYLRTIHVTTLLKCYTPPEKSNEEFLVAVPIGIVAGAVYPTHCCNKKFDVFALATIVSSFAIIGYSIYNFEREKEGIKQATLQLKLNSSFHPLSEEEVSKLKMLTPQIIWEKLQRFTVCPNDNLEKERENSKLFPNNLVKAVENKAENATALFETCSNIATKKWTVKYLNKHMTADNVSQMHDFAQKNNLKITLRQ